MEYRWVDEIYDDYCKFTVFFKSHLIWEIQIIGMTKSLDLYSIVLRSREPRNSMHLPYMIYSQERNLSSYQCIPQFMYYHVNEQL